MEDQHSCMECGAPVKKSNTLCPDCRRNVLMEDEILKLQKEGHTFHCAVRMIHGDGECECRKQDFIPGSISREMYAGQCPVCLCKEGESHADWCRNKIDKGELNWEHIKQKLSTMISKLCQTA